ncbi:hypothetical protein NW767_001182 [Fusarium falciforme]|uniref:Uncharacterized protein n=2 Tax=Fusarium falciforme TaxID=195108 RepID=A0A9W8RIQ8_9HYPO|nr:hypothetical protein NW755_000272 [Fusarium falciforme]KAJ4209275.1 hypothetical protein NW767_001182 [Fusarium falciforme]KAJ4262585.1 hypothetical protein NW757_000840 [Fusarium falciforme]
MLTVKQPPTYGYKSVHDLPTPPSTSRPSPPLIYQEPATKSLPVAHRSHSPPSQPMSAPHRGLPPPAAMTLPPQQPPAGVAPPPAHHAPPPPHPPPPALAPPSHQQRDSWGQLPAPPQQWQGAEESMKHWLQARAEEDKRRQEEERTKQESLRLEQRKVEMDMLRTSLSGGIPPPMVPLVFTGMASGGIMPQAALEWAQQFMPPSQVPRAQIMPAGWPVSPEHQRESQAHAQAQQAHAQHHGLPPGPAPPATGYAYPGSPTRQRGQTVSGAIGRPMGALPSLNTNVPQPTHGPPPGMHSHPHMHQAQQQQQQQHESQSSPSIYFHHWQPPTSQASGGSNRPGSPSGETPRKRKATGQHQPAPSPTRIEQRLRSPPPPFSQSSFVNPTSRGGRRGHTRQRSDMSPFRTAGPGRLRRESFGGPLRRMSPIRSSPGPSQERVGSERSESQKQSVSSLLSEEPRPLSQHSGIPRPVEEVERGHQQASPVETKPQTGAEEMSRREGTGEGEGAQG